MSLYSLFSLIKHRANKDNIFGHCNHNNEAIEMRMLSHSINLQSSDKLYTNTNTIIQNSTSDSPTLRRSISYVNSNNSSLKLQLAYFSELSLNSFEQLNLNKYEHNEKNTYENNSTTNNKSAQLNKISAEKNCDAYIKRKLNRKSITITSSYNECTSSQPIEIPQKLENHHNKDIRDYNHTIVKTPTYKEKWCHRRHYESGIFSSNDSNIFSLSSSSSAHSSHAIFRHELLSPTTTSSDALLSSSYIRQTSFGTLRYASTNKSRKGSTRRNNRPTLSHSLPISSSMVENQLEQFSQHELMSELHVQGNTQAYLLSLITPPSSRIVVHDPISNVQLIFGSEAIKNIR